MQPIRFADYRLDPRERRLDKAGVAVELGARAFDLLHVLVRRAGQLVSKAELMDEVWPDVVVEEANLHVQMTALRKAIGRQAIVTVPGRGYQFVQALLPGHSEAMAVPDAASSSASSATPFGALAADRRPPPFAPALPSLLGRDEDLALITQALAHPKRGGLVTVTGAGGSGKTLLARHLAARHGFIDGVAPVWVDLLELHTAQGVVPATAIAAGVQAAPARAEELAHALAGSNLLLVLDNAEHVLEPVAALVAALRRHAPGVQLLVTSQAPLRVADEAVHPLAGLSVPPGPCSAEQALRHAAVALFVTHAKQADRRFRFTDDNVDDVVAICASLGGSALGVQLAAGLLGQMPLPAVRARLARPHTGPYSAAVEPATNVLRSALSWSYERLAPLAQQVFQRLAIAQGPLPLALALAVATESEGDEASDALGDLVDRSLVQCEAGSDGTLRYRLLEAPRSLALECLGEGAPRAAALARLARALAPLGDGAQAMSVRDGLLPERAALHRSLQPVPADAAAAFEAMLASDSADAAATAIRVADLLQPAALLTPATERMRWAMALRERAVLDSPNSPNSLDAELRARACESAATMIRHSDLALREEVLLAAARFWHEAGCPFDEFRALSRAVDAVAMQGRHDEAAALLVRLRALEDPAWPSARRRWRWFAEGVAAISAGDVPRAMSAWKQQLQMTQGLDSSRLQALHSLANAEQIAGDAASALPRLIEAVSLARQQRMKATLHAYLLPNLIAAHVALGQLAAAREASREGWPHARSQDAEAWWADHLALLAAREGRPRSAARLLGLADAAYARLKDSRQALEAQAAATVEADVRAALGDSVWAALRAEGAEPASAQQVIAAALLEQDSGPPLLSERGRATPA
jgi:predicted ATPase/DNA-binding winged helix-turn-helix (wHTH) protein